MAAEETPSLTAESIGETHRVLECTQSHPPGNKHRKDPIWLWVVGEVTENWQRAEQVALFPIGPLPHIQRHNTVTWVSLSWWTPKAPPLTTNSYAETKKKKSGLSERTDQSSRKNTTKRWRNSQPIRCTVQNTGNQDAHRNGWIWSQNRVRSEGYEKWNKGKYTGNQQWREGNGTQIKNLKQKEEINIQPEQNDKTRIQKNQEGLRNLQDNFKCS